LHDRNFNPFRLIHPCGGRPDRQTGDSIQRAVHIMLSRSKNLPVVNKIMKFGGLLLTTLYIYLEVITHRQTE